MVGMGATAVAGGGAGGDVMEVAKSRRGVRLSVQGITRRLGERDVLAGVSLEARPGEFVAVVGKSGCGKTTLLRALAGLDAPTDGLVMIDGRARDDGWSEVGRSLKTADQPSAAVRMVFQDARLLPWRRVIDNVRLGLRGPQRHEGGVEQALARVGLSGRARDWPGVLSGGERQRVALARALVTQPGLLLLDEPLGALDALTRLEMQALLEKLWLEIGFTAVLVTHDVHEAVALADRIISLDAGRVALNIEVRLPRPRARHGAAFTAVAAEVLAHLLGERPPTSAFPPAVIIQGALSRIAG